MTDARGSSRAVASRYRGHPRWAELYLLKPSVGSLADAFLLVVRHTDLAIRIATL